MPSKNLPSPEEIVLSKIYIIRNQKVMLDRDLAALYGTETKRLKEAVRRNINRFPTDFMFELSKEELENWRTHFASSNSEVMGLRYAPMAFTEHGILMLSSVLSSDRAIQTNIGIIRIFNKMRQFGIDMDDVRLDIEKFRTRLDNQGKNIELLFDYLDELSSAPAKPERKPIGYK